MICRVTLYVIFWVFFAFKDCVLTLYHDLNSV